MASTKSAEYVNKKFNEGWVWVGSNLNGLKKNISNCSIICCVVANSFFSALRHKKKISKISRWPSMKKKKSKCGKNSRFSLRHPWENFMLPCLKWLPPFFLALRQCWVAGEKRASKNHMLTRSVFFYRSRNFNLRKFLFESCNFVKIIEIVKPTKIIYSNDCCVFNSRATHCINKWQWEINHVN